MTVKRPASRRQLLTVSALGLALIVPLTALPASASLPGGGFFVKAQDRKTAGINATAGLGTNLVSTPGAGGGSGSSQVFASYRCGALSFEVTKEMVDFSKANELLAAEGKWDQLKYHSGGWVVISHYDAASNRMKLGFPADGSRPQIVHLGDTTDIPNVVANPDDTRHTKLMFMDKPEYCSALDLRQPPVANAVFYTIQNSTSKEEVRYIEEDGDLKPISSKTISDGGRAVFRKTSPSSSLPAASTFRPYALSVAPDGAKTAQILFPTTVDGYNYAIYENSADGSGRLRYGKLSNFETLVPVLADRKLGPAVISWDKTGKITELYSSDYTYGGTTAASYNAATGQSWDGNYQKFSTVDVRIPFAPSS